MDKKSESFDSSIPLQEVFQDQADVLKEISETVTIIMACVSKLTDNYLEMEEKIKKIEKKVFLDMN